MSETRQVQFKISRFQMTLGEVVFRLYRMTKFKPLLDLSCRCMNKGVGLGVRK